MSDRRPVLVTGACSGVGRAVVDRLAAAGHPLITVDLAPAPEGVEVLAHVQCDLADPDSIDEIVSATPNDVSAVLNIAGVPGTFPASTVLEVNLLAPRRLTRALVPGLSPGASIVNVGSISGNGWVTRLETHGQLLALDDEPAREWWNDRSTSVGTDPYSFSKEALIVHSMNLAGELLGTGIRCNVVSPGPVQTPLLPTFREQIGDERLDWVLSHAGRPAMPDEIAQPICWLAVGESDWVNGHHLVVDGGYTGALLSQWIDASAAPAPLVTHVD